MADLYAAAIQVEWIRQGRECDINVSIHPDYPESPRITQTCIMGPTLLLRKLRKEKFSKKNRSTGEMLVCLLWT